MIETSTPVVTTLPNGLRIVADPMAGLESAAVGVWVKAGAMDEALEENGIAHLLEHMAFKGTKNRTAKQIVEEMEAVGGHVNAATSYPYTGYYTRILKNDIGSAVDLLADILINPLFDEAALATEKEVIVQEIGEARDTPDDMLFEHIQALTYKDQALGRSILGDAASVRRQTPASLRGFMDRGYRPDNTVIVASGGVEASHLVELVSRAFEGYGAAPKIGGAAVSAKTSANRRTFHTSGVYHEARDLEQTHIAFAAPGAALCDDDYFDWRLFSEALGGGMSSRLFQTVREDRGLAYSIYSYTDSYDDIGTTGVYLGVQAEDAEQALETSYGEIKEMAAGVQREELDRARALARSSYLMSLESPAVRAERIASQLLTFGRIMPSAEIVTRLEAVTTGGVAACARAFLEAPGHSLAVVGPGEVDTLAAIITRRGAGDGAN